MLEYLIKKPPVTTKQETASLIKVISCNALFHMLLVCIRSYLKSVVGYKFLILDTCHPDSLYLREQGCEDPWLLFWKPKGVREQKVCEKLDYALPIFLSSD